jgi:HlyD family secretion protein
MRIIASIIALVGLGLGGAALYGKYTGGDTAGDFRTAAVERGDLLITVPATGILEPEELVDVGAQVVGRIKELGPDPRSETDERFAGKTLDYGSPVVQGGLLARIDPSIYEAQHNQAKAAVERAVADLHQLEAKRTQTEAEWVRAQKLRDLKLPSFSPTGLKSSKEAAVPIKAISDSDYILAKANYEVAAANVEIGKAQIQQEQSTLQLAETNLGYTVIKSPIDGTIIDRRVNIGQTVVSAMNAPSLFLIARDLHRMQVWASVNEADIGKLKVDMPVQFKVDAFPDDVFRGKVAQIRLNAAITQNVVTYVVVISAENPDLKLLPYLSADVKFEIEKLENVLMVPNSALRFKPTAEQFVKKSADDSKDSEKPGSRSQKHKIGTIWINTDDGLSPIKVQVGATDGAMTEVSGEGVTEDLEVVVGVKQPQTVAAGEVNPFAPPRIPRRARN